MSAPPEWVSFIAICILIPCLLAIAYGTGYLNGKMAERTRRG